MESASNEPGRSYAARSCSGNVGRGERWTKAPRRAGRIPSDENVLRDAALWLRPAGWPLLAAAARRRALLLAWTAILAQVVFLGGWILAGALEPHYTAIRQYISEL